MADAKAAALDGGADVEEDAEGASEQSKSKSKFKLPPMKFLIIGAAALLLIGGGVGAYFFFFAHKPEAKVENPLVKPATFVDLPEILVNLSNPGAERMQYLRIKVVLELPEPKMIEQ